MVFIIRTPHTILSDQDRQLVSNEFQEFLKMNSIKQIISSPYNPTGNSVSERLTQGLKFTLQHFSDLGLNESVQLAETRHRYNIHRGLNCKTSELITISIH